MCSKCLLPHKECIDCDMISSCPYGWDYIMCLLSLKGDSRYEEDKE